MNPDFEHLTIRDRSRVYYRGMTSAEQDMFLKQHRNARALVFRYADGRLNYASYWSDFAPQDHDDTRLSEDHRSEQALIGHRDAPTGFQGKNGSED